MGGRRCKDRRGIRAKAEQGIGLSPSQVMGGAWPGGVLSFRRCGRSHEVRARGPLVLVVPRCRMSAGFASTALGGRNEVEAALKAAGPGAWGRPEHVRPRSREDWGWGVRPDNSRPQGRWAPRIPHTDRGWLALLEERLRRGLGCGPLTRWAPRIGSEPISASASM